MNDDEDIQEELEAQALELALSHNLVTPLTSMIVVEPDRRPEYEDDLMYAKGGVAYSSSVASHIYKEGIVVLVMSLIMLMLA